MRKPVRKQLLGKNRVLTLVLTVFVFGVALVIVNIYQLQLLRSNHEYYHSATAEGETSEADAELRRTVWVVANHVSR